MHGSRQVYVAGALALYAHWWDDAGQGTSKDILIQ